MLGKKYRIYANNVEIFQVSIDSCMFKYFSKPKDIERIILKYSCYSL